MGDTHGEPPDGKWLRDDWTQRAFESRSMCPGQGRVKARSLSHSGSNLGPLLTRVDRARVAEELLSRAAAWASNCTLKRVPSFAALRFGTTSDEQDWATSSSPRFRRRSIELATPRNPSRHGRERRQQAR